MGKPIKCLCRFVSQLTDVNSNYELYNSNQRLRNLLEDIFARRPDVHIVCGSIPPFADEWTDQNRVSEFNEVIMIGLISVGLFFPFLC